MNMRDPLTYRYPRTSMDAFGCDATQAVACQRFKTPLTRRALWFVCDWGWAVVLAAVFLLTGCDDMTVTQAVAQEATEAPPPWWKQRSGRRARRMPTTTPSTRAQRC